MTFNREQFLKNEYNNQHTENAMELVTLFGDWLEVETMKSIQKRHNEVGYISTDDILQRNGIVRKYRNKLT